MHIAFVDAPASVHHARDHFSRAQLATDNPLLAYRFPGIFDGDAALGQEVTNHLGHCTFDLVRDLCSAIADTDLAPQFGLITTVGFHSPLITLLSGLLHRAAAAAKAVRAFGPNEVSLHFANAPQFDRSVPFRLSRFASPLPSLARFGFFTSVPVQSFALNDVALPRIVNDTAIQDWGRRILMVPWPVLGLRILEKMRLLPARDVVIDVGAENEALRETLPWLVRNGASIRRVGNLLHVPAATNLPTILPDPTPPVAHALGAIVQQHVERSGVFSGAEASAISRVALSHISVGFRHLAQQFADAKARIDRLASGSRVFVTNGLFGALGAQVHALLAKRGVLTVEFEHGLTAGISAWHKDRLARFKNYAADVMLVCSRQAADTIAKSVSGQQTKVYAIGLPDQTRSLYARRLQCRLARRRLRLTMVEPVLMHVSAMPYWGNMRPGGSVPAESTVLSVDRQLLQDVYPELRFRVLFKQYPTQRFPYEPDYAELIKLAKNITVLKGEDFRYLRAAADVIVTGAPTSTLGWCLGTDVPLIWLDSRRFNALIDDDMRAAFAQSLIYVDLDSPDWPKLLRDCLQQGPATLREEWNSRASARARLLGDVIFGPPGICGRRAASVIRHLINGSGVPGTERGLASAAGQRSPADSKPSG